MILIAVGHFLRTSEGLLSPLRCIPRFHLVRRHISNAEIQAAMTTTIRNAVPTIREIIGVVDHVHTVEAIDLRGQYGMDASSKIVTIDQVPSDLAGIVPTATNGCNAHCCRRSSIKSRMAGQADQLPSISSPADSSFQPILLRWHSPRVGARGTAMRKHQGG